MHRSVIAGIAMLVAMAAQQCAAADAAGVHDRRFSESYTGATISTDGLRFESVYRAMRTPDGPGAAIDDGTLLGTTYPVAGHDHVTTYFHDGARVAAETFTLGPPHTDGIGAITGAGRCRGGTGVHRHETCTYRFSGTYDLATTIVRVRISGTYSRS
jgi:hypothetical protein